MDQQTVSAQETKKLTADEVIASHLESIGTAEARSAFKSLVAQGEVLVTIRIGGSGKGKGGAVMASQGPMSLIGLIFGQKEDSNEKMAFNGQKLTLGEGKPGVRTRFGNFLQTHDVVFREGLLGGTLSTAWPFRDMNGQKAKDPVLKEQRTLTIGKLTFSVMNHGAAATSISNSTSTRRRFSTFAPNINKSSLHRQ